MTVIVTPGIGAPDGSVTVPEIMARFTCASTMVAAARYTMTNGESINLIAPPLTISKQR